MRLSPLLSGLVALGLAACAHGGAQPDHHGEGEQCATASGEAHVKPGEAKLGDRTVCPVSGDEFVVSAKSPHVEHEGKTYYFCCPGCIKAFQKDPQGYIDGTHAKAMPDHS